MTDFFLHLLYKTVPGRFLLKGLVSPRVSRIAGKYLSSSASRWIVPRYIRKNGIKMSDIEIPVNGFSSYNDFFTRKRQPSKVPDPVAGQLFCPCDGMMSVVPIEEGSQFHIKGTTYSVGRLLNDDKLSMIFQGGLALIFRLTPKHYHRYCFCVDGTVVHDRRIEGKLHCVRPVALDTVPVFIQNSREYQDIQVAEQKHMIQMEIGALLVGKINNHPLSEGSSQVFAGMEKGYFEFGGSTIVLLFEKNMIYLDREQFEEKDLSCEVPVHMGQSLGSVWIG